MATAAVEAALKMTFGIFVSKARSALVDKLKDGDVTSQNIRELLLDDMDDIKSRIDALTLSELCASADFIRDGLLRLNSSLDKLDKRDKLYGRADEPLDQVKIKIVYQSHRMFRMPKFKSPFTFDDVFRHAVRFKSWLHRSDKKKSVPSSSSVEYVHFNAENLSMSISIITQMFPNDFETAMKYFYDANTSATKVFRNATLKLEDRIWATKLRIQSSLLMSLHDPSQAKLCKNYLKDLHELPEIEKNFRHDLEGGLLTQFNKDKRHDVVMSVSMINFALFRFLHCCSSKEPITVYDWPLIGGGDWLYNPLVPDKGIMEELQSHEIDAPNLLALEPMQSDIASINPKLAAINSEGELFLIHQQANLQVCELLKISGKTVDVFHTFEKFALVSFLTISSHDSVYVFVDSVQNNGPPDCTMYCVLGFDVTGDIIGKYENFLLPDSAIIMTPTPWEHDVALCISENIQEVINISDEVKMQVEQTIPGEEKFLQLELGKKSAVMRQGKKVEMLENHNAKLILANLELGKSSLVTITDKNHVITVEQSGHHVRVFDKRGELAREFDLHGGEREACVGITFNNLTKEMVVVSRLQNDFFLSTYSLETRKRCHYMRLSHIPQDCKELQLTSHGRGSIALVTREHVLFIQ